LRVSSKRLKNIVADEVAELQLLMKVVRAGNLSAAARALNSSPAAMGSCLSALESRLRVGMVTRTSRTFKLTEEGHLFEERRERIIAIFRLGCKRTNPDR